MHDATKSILDRSRPAVFLAALLAMMAGCGSSTTTSDVAYEDGYASDYYYPADVGYAGAYGVGWGYGLYFATPIHGSGFASPVPTLADAAVDGILHTGVDSGAPKVDSGAPKVDSGAPKADSGTGNPGSGATTVKGAVGEAIRNLALGFEVCAGHTTVTRPKGTATCGISGDGFSVTFNACPLSAGGTVDGTVSVQVNISASDANCTGSTTLSVGYTSTLTNLSYTGTGGAKIVIPNQTDMATIHAALGQGPTTVTMMSSGEIQRMASDGSTTSDRTYTGSRTFSHISLADQSFTVDGMINVTDKAGGTATMTGTGLLHDKACCKPTGGTLSVSRTGGSHAGNHTWTYSATCGSATLDGKTVTLPACL
jgi:hypothetical protein